ncbi:small ribosomal subunit Rsm22 family protein [Natronolimnohabitans innermongolicus]|uniref:Methyltransferase type 12 n=1 Tax=Natronolimnohabitans innermongolicus JCM 12255 TaxID=1227499 RepID=L9XIS3_9EURY|nr:class I SAM-dependent methyltransferase [Natronolimnohabitans innermongolicus]ELY61649.1 methyltransferase type 12 [Natronolimnohabitans innermongolicus JCM 12255]
MSDQREAVRSNAKYLRQVRPIDPDEICEYVEGNPHPAVVRQHLREMAPDLELLETDDGTFVPVEDDPVAPNRGPVERVPTAYEQRLEDLLVDRYGVNWHEDATGDLLRSTVRRFKTRYLERRPVEYDDDVAAGYAIYHLPGYYAAIQYALDDLAARGLLGRSLRVLDIGAGVGGPALGLCEYLPEDALLDYHAIEPSAAADVLEALLEETGRNVHPTVHRTTVESFDPEATSTADGFDPAAPDDGFDLIVAANVASELDDPVTVLRSALEWLAPDGTLLAMAPADKNTSVGLREIERELEDERVWPAAEMGLETTDANVNADANRDATNETDAGGDDDGSEDANGGDDRTDRHGRVTVYGPAVRLWPGQRPDDRGWTFDARPDLEVPTFQRKLDEATPEHDADHAPGEFVNVDVQFSYSQLRLDGRRRIDLALDTGDWARMADMERHVPNRIDLVAAKLSRSLSDGEGGDGGGGGRSNPLFKISDGSERIDHYAVLTKETSLNRPLLEADYGEVCSFEQLLALWNDDEEAYNLVVDEETIVDRIG